MGRGGSSDDELEYACWETLVTSVDVTKLDVLSVVQEGKGRGSDILGGDACMNALSWIWLGVQ